MGQKLLFIAKMTRAIKVLLEEKISGERSKIDYMSEDLRCRFANGTDNLIHAEPL